MAISSADQHLAVIPEAAPISHMPGSARASPRTTSDSPARAPQPISPNSRLLQPTLSWQAKAGWIPEPPAASSSSAIHVEPYSGSSQVQVSTANSSTRDQPLSVGGFMSPVPPSVSWQSRADSLQASPVNISGVTTQAPASALSTEHTTHEQAAQEKADHLSSLLQEELAKRGRPSVTPWQQQRLQLRAVKSPSGSPPARDGSPHGFRYSDATVDTLQQQRAKLRPVQTNKHAHALGQSQQGQSLQQGFVAPVVQSTAAAQPRRAQPAAAALPVANAGAKSAVRAPLRPSAEPARAAKAQLAPVAVPIASQASQLRTKFGQLTDLLQNTALQRGISLSEVPIPPTRKPNKGQNQRVSLEEVRTSFRSFTTASGNAAAGKPAPLRRVSTGAITPAFLKKKNQQDQALLESLGLATDTAADVVEDAAADPATATAAPAWSARQSSIQGFADETPAVVTRGKGQTRPTGPSFDIKLQVKEVQDEISSTAETAAALPEDIHAGQSVGSRAVNASINSNDGVTATDQRSVATTAVAAGKDSPSEASKDVNGQKIGAALQKVFESPANPSALVSTQAATLYKFNDAPSSASKQQHLQQTAKSARVDQAQSSGNDGIQTSGVVVDVAVAQDASNKTKAADKTGQPSDTMQRAPISQASTGKPRGGFGRCLCCYHSSTRE